MAVKFLWVRGKNTNRGFGERGQYCARVNDVMHQQTVVRIAKGHTNDKLCEVWANLHSLHLDTIIKSGFYRIFCVKWHPINTKTNNKEQNYNHRYSYNYAPIAFIFPDKRSTWYAFEISEWLLVQTHFSEITARSAHIFPVQFAVKSLQPQSLKLNNRLLEHHIMHKHSTNPFFCLYSFPTPFLCNKKNCRDEGRLEVENY